MDNIDKIFFFIIIPVFLILLSFFLSSFWLIIYDSIYWVSCKAKYINTEYSFFWWCKIKYNWEYIPENIYIETYQKNINLITK